KNLFECMVYAGTDGKDALSGMLAGICSYGHLEHLKRSPGLSDDIKAVSELKQIIAKQKPDILFLNSSKAGFIGSLAARQLRRKFPNMQVIYRIGGWTFNDPWPKWKKYSYLWL